MALPLRYRLASVMVGLNIITIGVLATFSYETSRRSLEQEALARAGAIAEGRQEAIVRLLQSHQQRLEGFLSSVVSLCGERAPNGRLSLEPECVHVAVVRFSDMERATAIELKSRARRLVVRGSWTPATDGRAATSLATILPSGSAEYTMHAARGPLTLRARFARHDVDDTVRDRSGLGRAGEVLLVDPSGAVLTATSERPASPSLGAQPWVTECLSGAVGQVIDGGTAATKLIVGFRPVPAIGGGCVMARIPYSEVLVPINRLGRQFFYASAGFVLLGIIMSFILAHATAQPIARLVAAARAMEHGQFDQPTAVSGPSEVRTLQRTFSRTAKAIGHLISREHAARLEAEAASRVKDDFLAALSHELRTPLNAILGWAAIASHRQANEGRIEHALNAIERNARAQARLIDDLLDVSRIASGRLRLNRTNVSLPTVMDAAIETVRPAAEAKEITIAKHVNVRSGTIFADPQRLQQVVWNLLSNAVRFTPERGRVDIRLEEDAGYAELEVADSGSGIPAELLPHVFDAFRQGESGATRRHGGLGLGLAIVRQLVELHGGTVAAESDGSDRGATFRIRLPLRAEAVSAANAATDASVSAELRGVRVVIVDDDPDARAILKTVLEDAGATVTVAASAEEARVAALAAHPDLLIADIGMPGEDGYSLMRSIRATDVFALAAVPAIAVTAHAQREDIDRALAAGFQLHLAKPVEPAHLLQMAANLVTSGHVH